MTPPTTSALEGATSGNLFAKLAGFQTIIPQFDNASAVTPKFFLDNVDHVTSLANCNNEEKLLVLKSRIRGDALSHIINSPDLSQEKDYESFKTKFLSYFDKKTSLATRQHQFANCRMMPKEQAKVFATRVANATQQFFGTLNSSNSEVKNLIEQTKMSKFIDGLLPELKKATLMKDPQSFNEALNYVELLQANEATMTDCHNTPTEINNVNHSNIDLLKVIECHAQKTHETVSALAKQIENLKFSPRSDSSRAQNTFRPLMYHSTPNFSNHRNTPMSRPQNFPMRFHNSRGFLNNSRQLPCRHCGRYHGSAICFYAPTQHTNRESYPVYNNRSRGNTRFSSDRRGARTSTLPTSTGRNYLN